MIEVKVLDARDLNKTRVRISLEQAITGCTTSYTDVNGDQQELVLPPGTHPGTIIKLDNQGTFNPYENT